MPKATSSPASSKPPGKPGRRATPTTKGSGTSTGQGTPTRARRARVDWEAVEPHYRAGIRALKDIGAEFEVSDAAIIKHARVNGWDRNLKAKIQAKADAKVSAAMVSAEVSAQTKITEAVRVEVEAEVQARVRIGQRKDIQRSRTLCMTLLGELESQTGNLPGLQDLGEMLRNPDNNGADKVNDIYRAVISLPERTKTMKALAESLKNLVALEREAFGIDTAPPPPAQQDYASVPADQRQIVYLKLVSGT